MVVVVVVVVVVVAVVVVVVAGGGGGGGIRGGGGLFLVCSCWLVGWLVGWLAVSLVLCLFACLPTHVGLGSGGTDNNRGVPAEGSCSAVLLVLELLAAMVTGSLHKIRLTCR